MEPGDDLKPGYFAVRVRLVEGRKPKLELKEYLKENVWDEISLEISSPSEMVKLLSKMHEKRSFSACRKSERFSCIMNMRRCVLKHRKIWKNEKTGKNVEICEGAVEHLGNFAEIEGEEKEVYETAKNLGFDISQKQPNYGAQLFYLERDGKLKFSADGIIKAAEKFMRK